MTEPTSSPENRIVEIESGKLRGKAARGLLTFRGIPYGQPTSGANRFRAPQPVIPWSGVRDALELGHPSVQDNPDFAVWLDPIPPGEDCLVLNVWAPVGARGLPVMVWIHGGAYTFGSGGAPLYDGGNLARDGEVVVVSINHRLQAFGFTDLTALAPDFADAGNAGMLDVQAAVAWVNRNIAAFGGNPGNITLFGQSGGGAKISMLMAMPSAKGLFHKAIVQSGSVFRVRTPDEAAAQTERLFHHLGLRLGDVAALQALPADVLSQGGNDVIAEATGVGNPLLAYAPTADGRILSTDPWADVAPITATDIPLMVGINRDETVIYMSEAAQAAAAAGGDDALIEAIIEATTTRSPGREEVAALLPVYRAAMPDASVAELVVQISTDLGFWRGAVHQADLQADEGAPVFAYRCDWRTPCFGGRWAPHSIEIPFIMGHPVYGPAWDGTDTEADRAADDPDNARLRVGHQMQAAWLNFAKTGNPSGNGLTWPAYDCTTRQTMIFDRQTRVEPDPRGDFHRLIAKRGRAW